jgi:hypothetical protein
MIRGLTWTSWDDLLDFFSVLLYNVFENIIKGGRENMGDNDYTSIGVKRRVHTRFNRLADRTGMHHSKLLDRLIDLWTVFTPLEREQHLAERKLTDDPRTDD